jgi:hypothetical protein
MKVAHFKFIGEMGDNGGSRWVGGKSFKSPKKKKRKPGEGRGENKVPKKTERDKEKKKKNCEGGGEKIKLQKKKLRSGLRKGKGKKSTWDGTGIEKRILSVHHPSTLVYWWMLVHCGQRY